ncbi:hypothetical protein BIV57_07670 [Mangrovactinospora gilvigrisea]|uniref:Uncharacterized protein n=1 Tax=Mangrovactinospora gilvigrisea TaxID=1428644 RepID=A0A1J7BX75_9ACTN|nr:hypothetical protein BIV57_07670 [Mangrovactinospora gilvigrisea]
MLLRLPNNTVLAHALTDAPALEAILVEAGFTPEQQNAAMFTAGGLELEDVNRLARSVVAAGFVPDRLDAPTFTPSKAEAVRQEVFAGLIEELRVLATGPDAPLLETLAEIGTVAKWAEQQADHRTHAHAGALMAQGGVISTAWEEAFSAAAGLAQPREVNAAVVLAVAMRDPALDAAEAATRLRALCEGPNAPLFTLYNRLNRMAVLARAGLGADGKGLGASFTLSAERTLMAATQVLDVSDRLGSGHDASAARHTSRVPQERGARPADPSPPPRTDDGGPPHGRHR